MTNSKNEYNNDDMRSVHDDCVEGDTEGDTSDEEDFDATRSKNSKRSSQSLKKKEGLEVASGSADASVSPKSNRRKLFHFVFAIAVVVAMSVAIGLGIYASTKNSIVPTTSTTSTIPETVATETVESSSTPGDSGFIEDVNPTKEEENDSIPDSDPLSIPKGDTLGILDELVGPEAYVESGAVSKESEDEEVMESLPTQWPELVGMTGEEAKDQLQVLCGEETYDVFILNENSPTTRDYRFNRIRVFTNDEGVVTRVPQIG